MEERSDHPVGDPAQILRRLLGSRGISQSQLASLTGERKQTVSKLINGKMKMTRDYAIKFAHHLGVQWPVLMGWGSRESGAPTETDILRAISRRIVWARVYRGLTISELAARCAMSEDRLAKIEAGELAPTLFEITTLGPKLSFSLDYLLLGDVDGLPYAVVRALPREDP